MSGPERRTISSRSLARQVVFDRYLRTGETWSVRMVDALAERYERKYNHNHDPADGRFTSGPGGPKGDGSTSGGRAKYYVGRTARGVQPIKPTSGGYVDANGRYVPEVFPPDPYSIKDPAGVLAHYMAGSGEPVNFYLNGIDTSGLTIDRFRSIATLAASGEPGTFSITDAPGGLDTNDHPTPSHFTEGMVVGGISLRAHGTLSVSGDRYHFSGWIGAPGDEFLFHPRADRSQFGDFFNSIGSKIPGKPFHTYIIGTKPIEFSGSVSDLRKRRR